MSDVSNQLWHGYNPSIGNGGHGAGLPFPGFEDGDDFQSDAPELGPTFPVEGGDEGKGKDWDEGEDYEHKWNGDKGDQEWDDGDNWDGEKDSDRPDDHDLKPPNLDNGKCHKWDWWGSKPAISVNLGNWLIPEWSWMGHPDGITYNGDIYSQCAGRTEECASEMRTNWEGYIQESDLEYISEHGANMVRIPVPFYAFIGTEGEEPYPTTSEQKDELTRILNLLADYDLHAVIDIHAVPGSQNGLEHSGRLGEAYFLTQTDQYWERGLDTVRAVVDYVKSLPEDTQCQIAGIENANEIKPENADQIGTTKKFAVESYDIVNEAGFTLIASDAFLGPAKWSDMFTNGENVALDVHRYWAYDDPSEVSDGSIADDIAKFATEASSFHLPIFVGEYSNARPYQQDVDSLRYTYQTQQSLWVGALAGSSFWAYKGEQGSDWNWRKAIEEGAIDTEENFNFEEVPEWLKQHIRDAFADRSRI
ncbi:glycoside hydrolase [Wallemia mellicola]|nr:glycoside hydrolase [Wallemia mellicola]